MYYIPASKSKLQLCRVHFDVKAVCDLWKRAYIRLKGEFPSAVNRSSQYLDFDLNSRNPWIQVLLVGICSINL